MSAPAHDPDLARCAWVPPDDALYCAYHDTEWGVPLTDPKDLFAKLILDGFQAGLSWRVILGKREAMEEVFEDFDPDRLAHWDEARMEVAAQDARIVRSPKKIAAAVGNAKAYQRMAADGVNFAEFLWSFVGGRPIQNAFTAHEDVPAKTERSEAMSKALKGEGFKFAGPVICYAFMQAVGMVDDHLTHCHRYGATVQLFDGL